MSDKLKRTLSSFFLIALFLGVSLWWLISGIIGLCGMAGAKTYSDTAPCGSYVTLDDYQPVAKLLRLDRSNGMGKKFGSCYYTMVQPAGSSVSLIIIATKEDTDKIMRDSDFCIKGKLVEPQYTVGNEIAKMVEDQESDELLTPPLAYFLDTQMSSGYIARIVEAVLFLIILGYILLCRHYWQYRTAPESAPSHQELVRKLYSKPVLLTLAAVLVIAIILFLTMDHALFPNTNNVVIPPSYT